MTIELSALQRQRRDTAANWTAENPTLLAGEIGIESDTGKIKIGNGSTAWASLGYQGIIPSSGVYPLSQLLMPSGTVGAPALTFTGDPNTGIYSPGADQLAISTNGSNRLQIDSSGNVGIGAAPVVTLAGQTHLTVNHSAGGTSVAGYNLAVDGTRYASFISYPSNSEALRITAESATLPITFHTNSSERMRLDSSGRLGLGTSAPQELLHVNNASAANTRIRLTNATTGTGTFDGLDLSCGSTGAAALIQWEQQPFQIFTNNGSAVDPRLTITAAGAVGIGTTMPGSLLEIKSADQNPSLFRLYNAYNTAGSSWGLDFYRDSDSGTNLATAEIKAVRAGGELTSLKFGTSSTSGTVVERARIDFAGRLLVGTSTSRAVSGVQWNQQIEGTGDVGFSIVSNATSNTGYINLARSRGTSVGSNTAVIQDDALGVILFSGANGTDLSNNAASIVAYVDGTPFSSGDTTDLPGRLVFSTTADGASSPTERMRITNSGNVGIGTTAPATKLHVAGNVKVSAASGNVELYVESGSLADGELSYIWAAGGSCQAEIGVYKHSGIGSPAAYMNLENVSGAGYFYWTDTSGDFRISSNSAHIGTTSGTIVGTQTSDERIKNILGPVTYGLDEIKQLDPVSYALKSDPDQVPHLGFIAQQVLPLVPESVFDTDEEIEEGEPTKLGMAYVALIPVLVNAIKELSAEVDALKAQL